MVHADAPQDGGLFAPDQHVKPPGEIPAVAVGIPHGDRGHPCGPGGGVGAAVADLPARLQGFQMGNPALPPQGGAQIRLQLAHGKEAMDG